jgi:phosphate transport system substrate-binding protein
VKDLSGKIGSVSHTALAISPMAHLTIALCCMIVLYVLWGGCQPISSYNFKAGSSNFVNSLLTPWFFTYHAIQPTFHLSILHISPDNVSSLILTNQLDFGIITTPLYSNNNVLATFPVAYGGVAVTFNIPNLPLSLQPSFVLDPELVVDIWLGNVNNWRDPKILSLNPSLSFYLPNFMITLILPEDPSSFTSLFGHMFAQISSSWYSLYGNTTEVTGLWPDAILYRNTTVLVSSNIFTDGMLPNIAYSISYLPIGTATTQGLSTFKILNRASVSVAPTQISGMNTIFENNPSLLGSTFVDITNYNDPTAYPFAGLIYVVVPTMPFSNCTQARELWKFFNWALVSNLSQDTAQEIGFGSFGSANVTVVAMLGNFTCDGVSLLQLEVLPQRQGPAFVALLVMSMIFFALAVVAAVCYFRFVILQEPGRRVELLYICILLIGCALNYTSVIAWYTVPSNDTVCAVRQWFTALGFTVMMGALFCRTWHLHKIYQLMHKDSKILLKIRAVLEILVIMAIAIFLQIVLLTVWTILSPLQATLILVDPINLTAQWLCFGDNLQVFLSVEFANLLAALLWGIWVLYRTWSFKDKASETRWLLIAIYNLILTLCIVAPLAIALPSTDDNIFFIAAVGIIFATSGVVFAIYLPKVLAQITSHSSSSRSPHTPGTGHSEHPPQSVSKQSDSATRDSSVTIEQQRSPSSKAPPLTIDEKRAKSEENKKDNDSDFKSSNTCSGKKSRPKKQHRKMTQNKSGPSSEKRLEANSSKTTINQS